MQYGQELTIGSDCCRKYLSGVHEPPPNREILQQVTYLYRLLYYGYVCSVFYQNVHPFRAGPSVPAKVKRQNETSQQYFAMSLTRNKENSQESYGVGGRIYRVRVVQIIF